VLIADVGAHRLVDADKVVVLGTEVLFSRYYYLYFVISVAGPGKQHLIDWEEAQ